MRSSHRKSKTLTTVIVAIAMMALNLALAPLAAAVPGSPLVSFSTSTASVAEDGGSLTLTVELDVPVPDSSVLVTVTTADVDALEAVDYAQFSQDLVIPAGVTSKDVSVTILDDEEGLVGEAAAETFTVTLSNPRLPLGSPSEATPTLGSPVVVTVTIDDDDDIVARDDAWDPSGEDLSLVTNTNVNLSVDAEDGVLANDDDRADADPGDIANEVAGNTVPSPAGTVLVNRDGSFDFEPATDFAGEVSFDYTVTDNTDVDSATATLRVNGVVTSTDDAYEVAEGGSIDTFDDELDSVLSDDNDGEDATPFSDTIFVSAHSTPANGQLTMATGPESDGHFVYTPDTDFNGTDTFTYDVSDGFGSTSTSTVTITVTEVNEAPTFTLTPQSVDEDAGAQTVAEGDWLPAYDDGDPTGSDADDQTVTFAITGNDNEELFSAVPSISDATEEWVLTYTPVAGASGTAVIEITATDDGTTDEAADPLATVDTFTISVGAVNDAPNVTPIDQDIDEDADPVTLTTEDWASVLDDGDPELDETLSFSLDTIVQDPTNPVVFDTAPAIGATGTLTFAVTADDHGSFTIPVTVTDDNETVGVPGDDEATTVNVVVTVNAINDEPNAVPVDQTIDEDPDPAAQSVAATAWTSTLDDGDPTTDPADLQTLSFELDDVTPDLDNPLEFAEGGGPAVDPTTGELTYTPAADANGITTLSIIITDDGGTENEADDNSITVDVDLTVDAINDAPNVTPDDPTIDEDSPLVILAPGDWTSVLDDGDPFTNEEDVQTLSYSLDLVTPDATNGITFSFGPFLDEETGTLVFDVDAEQNGSATFTITVTDDGGTENDQQPAVHRRCGCPPVHSGPRCPSTTPRSSPSPATPTTATTGTARSMTRR